MKLFLLRILKKFVVVLSHDDVDDWVLAVVKPAIKAHDAAIVEKQGLLPTTIDTLRELNDEQWTKELSDWGLSVEGKEPKATIKQKFKNTFGLCSFIHSFFEVLTDLPL
ncbi:MAG TPA: hypothetical protein V6C97_00785 [Oculatellaceae cyanobacterium]